MLSTEIDSLLARFRRAREGREPLTSERAHRFEVDLITALRKAHDLEDSLAVKRHVAPVVSLHS